MTNHNSRRDFLKHSLLATGSLMVPAFLQAGARQRIFQNGNKQRKLVVIQLSGGNDGLNTVIPFTNDLYYKARPVLGIKSSEVIKLNDELGLHPSLQPLRQWFDNGQMTVINNVGYPNPDRSHFRSMDIWQSASGADEFLSTGWLGRYLDGFDTNRFTPHTALEMDDTMSLALKGEIRNGYAVGNINQLKRTSSNKLLKSIAFHHDHSHEGNTAYLYKTLSDTFESADYLHDQSKIYKSNATYPTGNFGKRLKQTAELLSSGSNTSVYYITLGGFDTHANQKNQHARLLKHYAEGLSVFLKDLKRNGVLDDTLVMTFSEFGRRVKQNASGGTDHGTANVVFLAGGGLRKPGVFNDGPDLSNLDKGDLIYTVDFRQVYASLLSEWMGVAAGSAGVNSILGTGFSGLGVVG